MPQSRSFFTAAGDFFLLPQVIAVFAEIRIKFIIASNLYAPDSYNHHLSIASPQLW